MTHQKHECLYCKVNKPKRKVKFKKWKMIGLDRPYINLWFHDSCFKKVKGNLLEFLTENEKTWRK